MKIKTLGILSISALLGASLVPATFAQNHPPGFESPGRQARGIPGGGMRGRGEAPPAGRRAGRQPGENSERFLERHDTDGDGQISEEEFVARHLERVDTIFERRDADDDGVISLEENQPTERPDRPNRPQRPEMDREALVDCVRETIADYAPGLDDEREDRFDNADTDGDGTLSLAEVSAALETRAHDQFARIDADDNGFIMETELSARSEAQKNVRRVVQACVKEQRSNTVGN